MTETIPFNKPYMTGAELRYINEAYAGNVLAGDGPFTKKCHEWLKRHTGSHRALLTHSCTAALEMCALLLDLKAGDEIIMPSFTFVSTANAFVLHGGTPVFVDIRPDTLNIDEQKIEAAITPRTKAIVVVHYAGVSCEMDVILDIAKRNGLIVVEDAAQGVMSSYKGRPLGSIGDLGAYSFHETKNVISGEGGALIVNNSRFAERSEIIREKGTDRSRFFRGLVDKYTWQDIGSSYLPGEITAAFLFAQLEQATSITSQRISSWSYYDQILSDLRADNLIRGPVVPRECQHNAHMYYVLLNDRFHRQDVLSKMRDQGVHPVFHYVPLHSSPAGKKFGRVVGDMSHTNLLSERLIRLPLWIGITQAMQDRVADALRKSLGLNL